MISVKTWFKWASVIATRNGRDWLYAMEAELTEIADTKEQNRYAFGCFVSVLQDVVRSRRGLQFIARMFGAFLIIVMSSIGIWMGIKFGGSQETLELSRLVTTLCCFYLVSAGLHICSLRHLQIYAKFGILIGVSGLSYCFVGSPQFETLSTEFLRAIAIEATAFMMMLFLASIYLNWLYEPDLQNA